MEYLVQGSELLNLDALRNLILKFGEDSDERDTLYSQISAILLANIAHLNLDEDLYNVTRFGVGLTSEISPLLLSRESLGTGHWAWRPVMTKVGGGNSKGSDVRPPEKQVAAMINAFAIQLPRDPLYQPGAEALGHYLEFKRLWTADDEDNIEY